MSLESKLDDNYNILRLGVISSNSISSRTTLLVKHLSQKSSDGKHAIASMHAKSPVANKLISIVEIAKRDISEAGQKVFQYSAISFESISVKRTVKDKASRPENAGHGDSMADEEDVAFEVMGKTEKRRDIPVLTIYLSLSPIKELRDAYGASGLIRSDVPQKQMSRTKTWRIQTPLHIMQKPALWGLFEWYRLVLD